MDIDFCGRELSLSDQTSDSSSKSLHNQSKERVIPISPTVKARLEDFDFKKAKCIGKGTFGEVFRVAHHSTGKVFALKVLDKTLCLEKKYTEMITREIEIMYRLDHPYITKLLTHFEGDRSIYLIMPYAKKGQLFSLLRSQRRFDERTASQFVLETIEAVAYLHSFEPKIVHRDIKPENLLLGEDLRVRMCDFGISSYLDASTGSLSEACGSTEYMAPELIKGLPYDHSIDIWAIGVLLFELMAGFTPFKGRDNFEVISNITKRKINWPKDFPPLAKHLINGILQVEPKKRLTLDLIKAHSWFNKTHLLRPILKSNDIDYQRVFTQLLNSSSSYFSNGDNRDESLRDDNKPQTINLVNDNVKILDSPVTLSMLESNGIKNEHSPGAEKIEDLPIENASICYEIDNIYLKDANEKLQLLLNEKERILNDYDNKLIALESENSSMKQVIESLNDKLALLNSTREANRKQLQRCQAVFVVSRVHSNQIQYDAISSDSNKESQSAVLLNELKELKGQIRVHFDLFQEFLRQVKANQSNGIEKMHKALTASALSFNEVILQLNNNVHQEIFDTFSKAYNSASSMDKQLELLQSHNAALIASTRKAEQMDAQIASLEAENKILKKQISIQLNTFSHKERLYQLIREKEADSTKKYNELKSLIQNIKVFD